MLILALILLLYFIIIKNLITLLWKIIYRSKINNLIETIHTKEDLLEIRFKDLPNVMVELFKRNGYSARTTDKCGEDGNGLILNDIQFVEVWKHSPNQVVEIETAMKLANRMQTSSIYRGMIITLGDFKQNTRAYCHKNVISCVNGEQFLSMFKEAQKSKEILQTN
jgi:Restriction endonuclease.